MGKQLTAELIIQRTKTDKFDKIKNLNLWGNDLEDVSFIKELPNVEVLSLSVNSIQTLADFANCKKITELYLRKNNISNISEIKYLQGLPNLKVLWLCDNPCSELPNYRSIVIKYLPNLIKLDNSEINQAEREQAQRLDSNFQDLQIDAQIPQNQKQNVPIIKKETPKQSSFAVGSKEDIVKKKALKIEQIEPKESRDIKESKLELREQKNENILCAILSLLKELDQNSLELIKREVEKKINLKKS